MDLTGNLNNFKGSKFGHTAFHRHELCGMLFQKYRYRDMRIRILAFFAVLLCSPVSGGDAVPVTVVGLESLLIYPTRTAPASVVSSNDSRISAEVSAVIERIPVETGQVVEPDTILVELQQENAILAVREAEATLDSLRAKNQQAKDQLRRVRSLADKRSVTEELLIERETDVKVSSAALTGQQIRIENLRREQHKTIVRAPFKSIIVERLANEGELAMPGTPLLRVMDATRVEVIAELQPYDIPSLTRSNEVFLVSKDEEYRVRLLRIVPIIDERKRSQEVRLEFENEGALIGTSGHLIWRETSAYLPADLLVRRGALIGVFLQEGNRAHFREIPKAQEGRPALNPLPLDSMLILDGRFVVQDGQAIKVSPEKMGL